MRSKRNRTKYISADTRKCKACWDCIDECKYDVLGKVNIWFHKHVVIKNAENCRGCKSCISVCPNDVFELESTTSRKAGGLDFAANGGKRQGHAVP